ncbi:hypothetical protein [Niabella hibiscisoli]|uniref:hypothetical protein n=1 Tax=Niabella hibiscisoli TaxID=1825928 RepID=UPI001F106A88|nr:hypothetical protein [Niabella hibiscisoli]MCH5717844.1 hypothetical protein [Niabella hibiscisoli]
MLQNFPGVVQNTGWEIELKTENLRSKNLIWSTSLNFTAPKNALISFPGLESSSQAATYRINEPLSVFLGYQFQGVDPATGIYKLWDKDGNGSYTINDYIVVGNFDPSFYGGFQNTVRFKGVSLDFLFQFTKQLGRHPVYGNSSALGVGGNQPKEVLGHWRKPGDVTPYAKLTSQGGSELYNMYFLQQVRPRY